MFNFYLASATHCLQLHASFKVSASSSVCRHLDHQLDRASRSTSDSSTPPSNTGHLQRRHNMLLHHKRHTRLSGAAAAQYWQWVRDEKARIKSLALAAPAVCAASVACWWPSEEKKVRTSAINMLVKFSRSNKTVFTCIWAFLTLKMNKIIHAL